MSRYNSTVIRIDPGTDKEIGCFLAEVDAAGKIIRSNWLQYTGREGTAAYDEYLRRSGLKFEVLRDGGQHYRDRLRGLTLPPAYRR